MVQRPILLARLAAAAALCLAAAVALAAEPAKATSTPADQARFLAGLKVSAGSVLEPLTATQEFKDHVAAMDKAWPKLQERLDKAAAFEAAELRPLIQPDRKVIYFFGGPDAAHAVKLFPDAPAYLLAGLESVGAVEAPETMKPEEVHQAIDGLSNALRTFVEKSFFRTSEMGRDLSGKGIRGVMPVLYLFLARSGAEVISGTYFEVSPAGVSADKAPGEKWGPGVPGVRVRFQFPGKAPQEMSYVRVNLLDDELVKQPGFLGWARSFGPANGFLKAASFILHDRNFSKPRAFLLEACSAILEDDSGVPMHAFAKSGEWDYACWGTYMRPRDPFQGHFQADLDKACKALPQKPLNFIIGYRRTNDTFLLLAAKKSARPAPAPAAPATPVPAPAPAPAQ